MGDEKSKNSNYTVEKFCPGCGAPTDLSNPVCKFCGCPLPGIAKALSEENARREDRAFKKDAVDKVFGYLNNRLEKKQELAVMAEQRRRKREEYNRKEQTRAMVILLILLIGVPLLITLYYLLR